MFCIRPLAGANAGCFSTHELVKSLRIRAFRTLTDRLARIGCRPEVCHDLGLVGDLWGRWTLVGAVIGAQKVRSLGLFSQHSEQVFNGKIGLAL